MIGSQKIGKSFMGALNYNLRKLNHPDPKQRAELLETNFTSLDKEQIKMEVELLRLLRPNLNRYVYHTSLNFSKDEDLQNSQLLSIALQYLEAQGYTNNQYFIFRHHDADHPHLHLLVNRIAFDGSVVSDSNNYKKSENILRNIERRYDLISVEPSSQVHQRAANKDELEMVTRTGMPSEKMVLQEMMKKMLNQKNLTIPELIKKGEQAGINFLFNQASTGRVTGVTYFHNDFKIKGQSLGNSFKWAEIIKKIDYEQIRDSKAIGKANSRTRAIYGELTITNPTGQQQGGNGSNEFYPGNAEGFGYFDGQPTVVNETGNEDHTNRKRPLEANQDADTLYRDISDTLYRDTSEINILIADDEDDAKKYRKRNKGR
jgi:hypothetical protein